MKKCIFFLMTILIGFVSAYAQTDYTSFITNPSFEQDATGWTKKDMNPQGNNVFSIKQGNTYMEKWTGRGGAVGDAYIGQEINNLPPGNYELSAAAQNIQEDSPTAAQSGAWIFAGNNKTNVTVRDTYKVSFNYVSGPITIGFQAVGAKGNWIAVDNFKLTLVGQDLSEELAQAISDTKSEYGSATGNEIQQLKDAISAAEAVAAKGTSATAEEQAAAIVAMENAVKIYLCANASSDEPMDMTDRIVNPSFETGDFTGWTNTGMQMQGNDVFNIKQGTWYVERWTGRGGAVGDGKVSQRITGLPGGKYRLTAVAQNIQEDTPNAAKSGAWIFAGTHQEAVTTRNTYTLEFVLVSDELEIGFEAKNAQGNWLAVDNFKLEYISNSMDDVKNELISLIAKGESLTDKRMNSTVLQTLQSAIDTAKPLTSQGSNEGWGEAARILEAAIADAETSIEIFSQLAQTITAAQQEIDASSAVLKDDYQNAINAAQSVYDNSSSTNAQAQAAIKALEEASFEFKVTNGTTSGTSPTVKTDPRFIKGCQWAFGRSTVSGSNIIEQGFCWSEDPDPKVTDNRTTEYINHEGRIYWLRDLKPGTMYYMRAYAINKDYAVGYGDVIKFATVPKGTVGHWYNNGGDEATNDRINYAIDLSMDYYWNNLTSIHGFGISVNYSPGTPTADCSYGGWMRVGENPSYQQPGTIMHEAFHGIGVGTHDMWWNGDMRSAGDRGDWLGDRVTEAVRFWDNSTTAVITGDNMHLWPYGCNGAQEDTHSDVLYCMMGILAQALNEDGLPASGEIGYALPYYSFNHEDGVKYYIKNEDENRGLRSAYLVETSTGELQWKSMSADEAVENDAAAWYISFTPNNQYYQLRNAGSGKYMTYSSGFKTATHSTPTSADNIHLMRGRVNVEGHRGYYFIHPQSNSANPPTLIANANGKTGSGAWSILRSAKTQRWLILTAKEAENFDNGNMDLAKEQLKDMLAQIRKLKDTPHTETVEGADENLTQQLAAIENSATTCTKGSEVENLNEQARAEGMSFLSKVSATDLANPFDLTFMIDNPDFDNDAVSGWTSTNGDPGYDAKGAEFFEKVFDYYQILANMPKGTYELRAYAFQRPGAWENVLAPYTAGTAKVTTSLYINNTTSPVCHICEDRQQSALFNDGGWGSDQKLTDNTYIPNCMTGAEKYFAKGLYDSSVAAEITQDGGNLRVGIKCTSAPAGYWTMFDHFRLYFFGGNNAPVGIEESMKDNLQDATWFNLQGQRVEKPTQRGIYIVNGKKVFIR